MGGFFIDVYIEYLVRAIIRTIQLFRSRSWSVVPATVLSAECELGGPLGCAIATVYYEYIADGQKYGSWYSRPFINPRAESILR